MNLTAVADLVETVKPFKGQDAQLVYHVYSDLNLTSDASIAGWTLAWTLFHDIALTSALLIKTTSSGITLASPLATVALAAADLAALSPFITYYSQLWRNEAGNKYPLTGVCPFQLQLAPPLS